MRAGGKHSLACIMKGEFAISLWNPFLILRFCFSLFTPILSNFLEKNRKKKDSREVMVTTDG
jgi:hypothetical protein